MDSLKILCLAAEPWTDCAKRNMSLMKALSAQPGVQALLYVNPAVLSSISDVIKGQLLPGDLGQDRALHWKALRGRLVDRVTDKIWTYTGSQKTLPLTRFTRVRRWELLRRVNRSIYCRLIERCLNQLPGERLVIWLSYPLHAFALDAFSNRDLLVYDWMDAWEHFNILPVEDPQALINLNGRILKEADIVFVVSQRLARRAEAVNQNVFLVPNATDFSSSDGKAEVSPAAAAMDEIPAPRIGYAGQIGDKFDFSLVRSVAKARPDWSLVLIGPVWVPYKEEIPSLQDLNNVHFLGRRPRREMPALLTSLDVCVIPHLVNELTLSMDPIKIYDYMATGRPIVSTGVAGVDRFDDVIYVRHDLDGFLDGIESALRENDHVRRRRLIYAQENTWSKRGSEIWRIMEDVLAKRENGQLCGKRHRN